MFWLDGRQQRLVTAGPLSLEGQHRVAVVGELFAPVDRWAQVMVVVIRAGE